MSGWGSGGWGSGPWGSGAQLQLLTALALRENAVLITFSEAPYFTGTLEPHDASNPLRYSIVVGTGVTGGDGNATRAVSVVEIERLTTVQYLVILDRPMSPYPATYLLSVNQLITASAGQLLDSNFTSVEFFGTYKLVQQKRTDLRIPSRDIANPQTLSSLLDPLPITHAAEILGTIPVNDEGDYAFDEGVTNLKKRIYRRLLTTKGAFAGMPDYGVGVPREIKRLSSTAVRNKLAAEAQKQLAQEPDVLGVSVKVVTDSTNPSITRFQIRVKAKFSDTPVSVDVPFSPTE